MRDIYIYEGYICLPSTKVLNAPQRQRYNGKYGHCINKSCDLNVMTNQPFVMKTIYVNTSHFIRENISKISKIRFLNAIMMQG